MKKNCQKIDPINEVSSNLGNQNLVLKEKLKKFLGVSDLKKWKECYQGEILEIFISLKASINYSLANDFISYKLNIIIKEYFIFYFKYFLIALFRLNKMPNDEENLKNDDLEILVLQKSFGLFEESKKNNFITSKLLDIILDFLDCLNDHKKTILDGSHQTAKAILLKQFLQYCVLQKAKKPLFINLKNKKQIIYSLHQNKDSNLYNDLIDLKKFEYFGRNKIQINN
jgi:hypothetical protein